MAKKKEASSEASTAVSTSISRYTSPPVTLRVGADLESFYVPEFLLQSLNDLPRSGKTGRVVHLPDVDVDTGHIIVHFLHTGQYQTLRNSEEETASDHSKADFKKAIAAFIAAKKYGLATLQELAKDSIFKCAEGISITQAAHGVGKDSLAALQEDAGWLQELVMRKVEQTFRENDEIFSSASFFSGIESLKLAKLCGQQVAKLYYVHSREVDKELSELQKYLDKQGDLLKNWSGTEQAEKSAPAAQLDQATVTAQASLPLPPVEEVPIDDWTSFASTKKKKKKARIAVEGVPLEEPEPVAESEHELVPEPVMEASPIEHIPVTAPHPAEEAVETTADNVDVADTWEPLGIIVSKKKKKKGKKIALEEEAAAPEPDIPSQALEALESSPANVDFTSSNKWQEVPSVAPTEVITDVALEPAAIVDDSPVVVEPPPTNEQEASWPWGATLGSGKKKKKKKSKAAQTEASLSPPPPPAEHEERMGDDLIEPETASQSVPASSVDGDIRVVITEETNNDKDCPFLSEHLSQSEGWKDCRRCELHMRKIAIKLHTAGSPDINRLVAR